MSQTASETTDITEATGSAGLSRRRAMAVCSMTLLGAAGLAACGGGSDDTASTGNVTTAPAASSPAPAGSPSTGSGGTSEVIAKESSIPTGDAVSFELDGKPIIVAVPAADQAVAFSAVCPHQGATVAVKGDQLVCPLHGSVFEKLTGAFVSGPAAGASLTPIAVKVDGGNIVTA